MTSARVLIVDDHEVVVEGIKSLLGSESQFEVVGEAVDGREAVEKSRDLQPDIVVMDISMAGMNGIEATLEIKKAASDTSILIYSMHSSTEYVIKLFQLGVAGYVLKDGPVSDLVMALKSVQAGGNYFSTEVSEVLARHLAQMGVQKDTQRLLDSLSSRELEVFKHLADGKSVKAIGEELYISSKTVETHKYNIMKKLNVSSLADLTKIAIRNKLIKI